MTVKELIKYVLLSLKRNGYYIDEDTRGIVGLAVAVALRKHKPENGRIETLAIRLAERFVIGELRKRRKYESLFENAPYVSRPSRDDAQRFLVDYPEPLRTMCWAIWIERRRKLEVMQAFRVTRHQLDLVLDRVATKLRKDLDNTP